MGGNRRATATATTSSGGYLKEAVAQIDGNNIYRSVVEGKILFQRCLRIRIYARVAI
jgi:hypothetical protein